MASLEPRGLDKQRLARLAAQREATRVYKDDLGHSWTETTAHFDLSLNAAKSRVYKARKERAAEARDAVEPPLPLPEPAQRAFELDGE